MVSRGWAVVAAVLLGGSAACGSAAIEGGSDVVASSDGDTILFPGRMPAGLEILRLADVGGLATDDVTAGPVIVLDAPSRMHPRTAERVVVCAHTVFDDPPEMLESVDGTPIDLGGLPAVVTASQPGSERPCWMPMSAGVAWAEGPWLMEAVSLDGDVDRAIAVARVVSPDPEAGRLVVDGDLGGLAAVGDLRSGWTIPEDPIVFTMWSPQPTYDPPSEFDVTIQNVDEAAQAAIVGRMLDDPGPTATLASTPVYSEEFGEARRIDVDGTDVWVGGWSDVSVVAVIEGDPGVAVYASSKSYAGDLPSAAQLAEIAAGARAAGADEVQSELDAAVDRAFARARAGLLEHPLFPGTEHVVDDEWGTRVMSFEEWVVGRPVFMEVGIAYRQTGGSRAYGPGFGWSDAYDLGSDDSLGATVVPIPRQESPTLREPAESTLEFSGFLDVFVVAAPGVDVTVQLDGDEYDIAMMPIETFAARVPPESWEVRPLTTGERWGHLVVDTAGMDADELARSLAIVAGRSGVEVGRSTSSADAGLVPVVPGQ